jgi:hypothetical protein
MTTATAERLLALVVNADPITAYLVAWTAFEHLVKVTARCAGVRPKFGLRKNGTVEMQTVGAHKMPVVTPPRPEQELEVALARLPEEVKERLVAHPAVQALALRVPRFAGRPLVHDARGQRLSGVLDLTLTADARYPIWRSLDLGLIRSRDRGDLTPEQRDTLVAQIAALLTAVWHNLLLGDEDGPSIAALALPLVRLLVEGLQDAA